MALPRRRPVLPSQLTAAGPFSGFNPLNSRLGQRFTQPMTQLAPPVMSAQEDLYRRGRGRGPNQRLQQTPFLNPVNPLGPGQVTSSSGQPTGLNPMAGTDTNNYATAPVVQPVTTPTPLSPPVTGYGMTEDQLAGIAVPRTTPVMQPQAESGYGLTQYMPLQRVDQPPVLSEDQAQMFTAPGTTPLLQPQPDQAGIMALAPPNLLTDFSAFARPGYGGFIDPITGNMVV